MAPSWTRKKAPTTSFDSAPRIRHCVTVVDLTSFGIANTFGIGLHVLLGHAAHDSAGPSVVLSFILLSVAALLSGLCICELADQFPNVTGWSSYAYTYRIIGELCAFVLGWNVILELAIGSAVAAKAWTQYADLALFNGTGAGTTFSVLGMSTRLQSGDVAAFLLLIAVAIFTSMYVKVVCIVNNVLVIVCVLFTGGTVFVGLFNADSKNWTSGVGFFPNGVDGIVSAVSLCAFSFVGVELMTAMSAETLESKSYARLYSTSVGFVFVVGLLVCFAVSVVVTLVVPHSQLSDTASIARIFVTPARAVAMSRFVFIGATCGLFASTLTCSATQGRVLQAIAGDGLLPIDAVRSGAPMTATLACGVASALLALLLDVRTLLAMLGVGTLLGMAAAPILVLVNRHNYGDAREPSTASTAETAMIVQDESTSMANDGPSTSATSTGTYGATEVLGHQLAVELVDERSFRTYALWTNQMVSGAADDEQDDGRVPCAPWLPLVCLAMHLLFLICLPLAAWIRFLVWTAIGVVVYAVNQIRCGDRRTDASLNSSDQDLIRPDLPPIGDRSRCDSTEMK